VSGGAGDMRVICAPGTIRDCHFTTCWTLSNAIEIQTFGAGVTKSIK